MLDKVGTNMWDEKWSEETYDEAWRERGSFCFWEVGEEEVRGVWLGYLKLELICVRVWLCEEGFELEVFTSAAIFLYFTLWIY